MKEKNRGTTKDEFTLNIDLAPTILGAAGLPIPHKMMGRDMSQLYLSPEPIEWRNDFFYEHPMISKKSYVPRLVNRGLDHVSRISCYVCVDFLFPASIPSTLNLLVCIFVVLCMSSARRR
jgi:hypothetical protein